MPKLGAHLSIGKGYADAVLRIAAMGGSALQVFAASPRGWNLAKAMPDDAKLLAAAKKEYAVEPVYFHASYLINLADAGSIGHMSKQSLIAELAAAAALGVRGSIVHLGSFKLKDGEEATPAQYGTLEKNIKEVLEKTPKETLFIIENAGNRKIGRDIREIGKIVSDIKNPRLRVCLDTCHLHAAGYDLSTAEKLDAFLAEFDRTIGLDRLELIHANDSRDPFGSLRDRHDNIGEGAVGKKVFRLLLHNPKTKNLPFIIETPGFDDTGPDKKNLDILKSLAR